MSERSVSAQLVEQAKVSLENLDESRLADALEGLVAAEPARWQQLLLLAGVWPEPSPQKVGAKADQLAQTLSCLLKAMQTLLSRDVDHVGTVQEVMLTLQGFFILQAYYRDIADELKKLAFVNSPPEVQIHRLVALVEGQSRTLQRKLTEIHEAAGVIDPLAGHTSSVPTRGDDSKVSLGQAFDTLCENIELGLRFILHSHLLPPEPTFQAACGPYNDPDIEKFGNLAGIWRLVAEAWANMRFRGWRWTADGKWHGCVPADSAAFLREHAGAIRYQLFIGERIFQRLTALPEAASYFRCVRAVSGSITVPAAGERWDGKIDVGALKGLCELSRLQVVVEEYVNERHYLPLIDLVRAGSLGWREWVAGKGVLVCLADAMSQAATDQVPDGDLACMRQVVVVPEEILRGVVVACGRLTGEQARDLLNALRFDPKRKSLEVWDQPLIPCGEGLVFLVPSLVTTGNPARALENFVTQWGGVSFDERGTPFEEYVVAEIRKRSTARAERGITIHRPGEKDLEFDVVVWWEGYLLLLEAKCEKTVFSPADYHRARRQVEKSINQLVLRREALPHVWSALREKVPSLGLPESYVGDDRVLCVSITNIMDFTGYSRDGVVVTDDSCFFRFFGDRMVKKYVGEDDVGEDVEPIRAGETPHPAELIPYLLNPVQMRRLTDKMRLRSHLIPGITERSPGFISVHVELDP